MNESTRDLEDVLKKDMPGNATTVRPAPDPVSRRFLVTRIIANLVGNAVKFTPEGKKVTISVERNGDGAKFYVADTGSGIPPEYHEKIFEKFGQVKIRQQMKMYSTGLGLTFCKLAVEAHGGEIGVESEADKGSTFWFTLPEMPTGTPRSPA